MTEPVYFTDSNPISQLEFINVVCIPFQEDFEMDIMPTIDRLRSDVNTIQLALSDCENENMNGRGEFGSNYDSKVVNHNQYETYKAIRAATDPAIHRLRLIF